MSRKATKKNGIQGIVSVIMRIYFYLFFCLNKRTADFKNAICFFSFWQSHQVFEL